MKLFAAFIGLLGKGFVGLFSRFMGFKAALQLAGYATWITVLTTFITAMMYCLASLHNMIMSLAAGGGGGGDSWVWRFWMGLGMFVPSNAGAVMACVASVWLGTSLYCIQRDGLFMYGSGR